VGGVVFFGLFFFFCFFFFIFLGGGWGGGVVLVVWGVFFFFFLFFCLGCFWGGFTCGPTLFFYQSPPHNFQGGFGPHPAFPPSLSMCLRSILFLTDFPPFEPFLNSLKDTWLTPCEYYFRNPPLTPFVRRFLLSLFDSGREEHAEVAVSRLQSSSFCQQLIDHNLAPPCAPYRSLRDLYRSCRSPQVHTVLDSSDGFAPFFLLVSFSTTTGNSLGLFSPEGEGPLVAYPLLPF